MKKSKTTSRLQFLDWLRGFGAVIMLQGHTYHSLLRQDLRTSSTFVLSDFLGGLPSAVFLFLTGVTLAFLMDSRERHGVGAAGRWWSALRRAGYILGLAFLFRLQLWLFAWPGSAWTDLLRVDVLNCMGLALATLSVMAVFTTLERIRFCALLGVAIASASPLVSQIDWSGAPALVKEYIAPDYVSFGFFPWAAFVAFGLSAGSLIRVLTHEQLERAMQWCALAGCVLIVASQHLSDLPSLYGKSEFWLNSPFLILIKLGVILLLLAFAFLWTKHAPERWSWVRQLGTTSLLVYWVHIELVYGRWLSAWHSNLTIGESTAAAAGMIGIMVLLSAARTNYRRWLGSFSNFWRPQPLPSRVPGD
ncbi:MAG TPA: heparan-alpha-glucosaminide N-acetyltransferase domain-containing protein [Bryobacteraceae bacterium]|nr:heparan-alpha-glucosaminide N-acetyltransferase domain-containing protein [Bryobacteraceae bacterium]